MQNTLIIHETGGKNITSSQVATPTDIADNRQDRYSGNEFSRNTTHFSHLHTECCKNLYLCNTAKMAKIRFLNIKKYLYNTHNVRLCRSDLIQSFCD